MRARTPTDPSATLTTPPEGAVYTQGQSVTADFECSDSGGSGLASCVGTAADGSAVDTSTLGSHDFKVTATDGAGQHHGGDTRVHGGPCA